MAYDFSNIRSIVRANGTELSKITDSSGTVIWQKLYVWEKFNRVQTLSGYTRSSTSTTISAPTSGHMYTSLSFNSSTGAFTLGGDKSMSISGVGDYWKSYHSGFEVTILGDYNDGYKYFKSGSNYYALKSRLTRPYPDDDKISVYKYTASPSYTYSKGTESYGYVTSTSSTAYPDNNYSGSYWYVRIA